MAAPNVTALLDEARACQGRGDYQRAATLFTAILSRDPRHRDALFALGGLACAAGRFPDAIQYYRRAIAVDRKVPELHLVLGIALQAQGELKQAQSVLRRAVSLRPTDARAHYHLGVACWRDEDLREAAASLRRAIGLKPDYAEAHCDLGVVLAQQGRIDDAVAHYRSAISLKPAHAAAHNNLGSALTTKGLHDEAIACFERAIALEPEYAVAHANLATSLLLCGRFEEGWREQEYRWRAVYGGRHAPDPRAPDRELPLASTLAPLDFAHKRVVTVCDEGLGDELFYLRYAPVVAQRGGRLAHIAAGKLAPILRRVPCLDLVDARAIPADADHVILLSDLPLVLGATREADIPPPLPLAALPDTVAAARRRLSAAGPGPYLGVAWRAGIPGRVGGRERHFKEAPLDRLARAVRGWEGEVVIVQRNPRAGEIAAFGAALGRPAHDFSAANESLEEMLGLLAVLDDYVTVSNTNIHLRAGLGRPARVLVPYPPEWRWMADGPASPWYPDCEVHRESVTTGWDASLAALAAELRGARTRAGADAAESG